MFCIILFDYFRFLIHLLPINKGKIYRLLNMGVSQAVVIRPFVLVSGLYQIAYGLVSFNFFDTVRLSTIFEALSCLTIMFCINVFNKVLFSVSNKNTLLVKTT